MASFDDREKGFEQKYKHDKELEFKITARRNKLVGLWAAAQFGMSSADAEAYAKAVVMSDLEKAGDEDIVGKLLADFQAKGIEMTAHRIRRHIDEFAGEARRQVMAEVKE